MTSITYIDWLKFVISTMKAANLKAWRARPVTEAILARRERDRRYNATEKGRARGARYDQSPHGRRVREDYEWSYAGQISRFLRRAREGVNYHQGRLAALDAE